MKQKFSLLLMLGLLIGLNSCDLFEEDESGVTIEVTDDITQSVVWKDGNVYVIDGTLTVEADLTIEAGAEVRFKQNATIEVAYYDNVYARIIANGTADKPIRFTSNAPSPAAGDWQSIELYDGSDNSVFTHCIFEYGGSDQYKGAIHIYASSAKFDNCQFRNISNSAILLKENGFFTEFINNSFSTIEKHAIQIESNKVHTIGADNNFDISARYGIEIRNHMDIAGDYTWLAHNTPYIISEDIDMGADGNGINLTIAAGARFQFAANTGFELAYYDDKYAKIIARGTLSNPIVFTSNNPSPQAGDYNGFKFYDGTQQSVFEYCTIEYAGKSEYYGAIYVSETNIKLSNCTFNHNLNNTVYLKNNGYFGEFTNNEFNNLTANPIKIEAKYAHTIGEGNLFNAGAYGILIEGDMDSEGQFTWLNHDAPYIINDNVEIGSSGNGTVLSIAAGTTIKFNVEKGFEFAYNDENYGKIIAQGTATNPIIFTSSKPSPEKGDWKGFEFYSGSNGSILNFC